MSLSISLDETGRLEMGQYEQIDIDIWCLGWSCLMNVLLLHVALWVETLLIVNTGKYNFEYLLNLL